MGFPGESHYIYFVLIVLFYTLSPFCTRIWVAKSELRIGWRGFADATRFPENRRLSDRLQLLKEDGEFVCICWIAFGR